MRRPSYSVHRNATCRVSPGKVSVIIGPCRVIFTSTVTSGWPLMWMSSVRCSGCCQPCGVWYAPCPLKFSMKASVTVGPTLVNPQAIRWLWPTITYGIPGSVTPATSRLHDGLTHFRCASYHRFGIWCPRCISSDSRGLPVTVCAPETTQSFDPFTASGACCAEICSAQISAPAPLCCVTELSGPSSSSSSSSPLEPP